MSGSWAISCWISGTVAVKRATWTNTSSRKRKTSSGTLRCWFMCSMWSRASSIKTCTTISRASKRYSTSRRKLRSSVSFTRWIWCRRISASRFLGRDKRIWRSYRCHLNAPPFGHQFGMKLCTGRGAPSSISWSRTWNRSKIRCINSRRFSTPTRCFCLSEQRFWSSPTVNSKSTRTHIDSRKYPTSSNSSSSHAPSWARNFNRWKCETASSLHSSTPSPATHTSWWSSRVIHKCLPKRHWWTSEMRENTSRNWRIRRSIARSRLISRSTTSTDIIANRPVNPQKRLIKIKNVYQRIRASNIIIADCPHILSTISFIYRFNSLQRIFTWLVMFMM